MVIDLLGSFFSFIHCGGGKALHIIIGFEITSINIKFGLNSSMSLTWL